MKKNNKKIKFTSSVISACMVTTNIYPAFASEIVFENDATDIEALEENKNKEVIEESIKNESIGDTEGSEGVSVTEDTYVEDGAIKDIDDEEVELKESLSELPSNDVVVKEDEVLLSDNDMVNIEDQVLLQVINKELGKGYVTTAVTKGEMERIETLHYDYAFKGTIKSLEGLQYATNLKDLLINKSSISDVSPLASLTKLEVLNLAWNRVSSVEPLASLSKLKELDLSYNNITDISGLSSLENLKYLYLDSNKISDIKVIGSLDNLVELSLSENQISDISGLSSLENLGRLQLSSNKISDIRGIGLLDNLVELYLAYNQITDISGLSSLENLHYLYLSYNQISDISGLGGLKNLKILSLKNNYISDIRELSLLNHLSTVHLNDNSIYDISPVLEIYKNSNNPYLSLDVTGNFIDFTPGSRGFEIYCLLNEVSPLDVSKFIKVRLNSDYQFKVEFSNDNVSLELGDIYETSADLVMVSMDGDEIYRQKANTNELNYEVADTNIVKINEKNYIESCGEGTTSVKVKYRNLSIFEGHININVYGNVKKPELQFKDNILTIKDTNIGCSSGRAINVTNKIESFNGDEEIIKLSNPNWVRDDGYLISEGIKLGEGSGNAEYLKSTSTEFIVNSKEADAVEIEWLSTWPELEVIITVNGKEMFAGPGEVDLSTLSPKVNVTKLDMEKGDNHIKIVYRINPDSFPFVSEERAAVDLFGYMMIDSITLTKTCTRVADKLEYRVNGREWKEYNGPVDFTDLGENTVEVEARAVIANTKSEIAKGKYEVVKEDSGSSENEGNGSNNDSNEDNDVTDEGVDVPGVEGDFNKDEESKEESPKTGDAGILNYVIMLSGSIAVLLSRLLVIKRDKEK